jgi:hypothetical protein
LLDQASANLAALDIVEAQSLLELAAPAGDFDQDGDVDGTDFLTWQRQLGSTGLFPLNDRPSDANADGVVDAADLAGWRQSFEAHSVAQAPALSSALYTVPEPAARQLAALIWLAGVYLMRPWIGAF